MIHLRRTKVSATDQQLGQPADCPIEHMTTYELRELRRKLEETLAMETLPRYTRPRAELQQQLTEVIAEQADRERMRQERYTDA
jgi:hypothetical protein